MEKKQIKLTLIRSVHGRLKAHIACASGLGLTKINQTVSVEDNPCIRGMINKISYMLKVEG